MIYLTCIKHESDMMAANLQYHYRLGFRQFGIMFNGSDDATYYSVDKTMTALEGVSVTYYEDDRVEYLQPERLTMMSEEAHQQGHLWVCPVDADELIVLPPGYYGLAQILTEIEEQHASGVIKCRWIDMVPDASDDMTEPCVLKRWQYRLLKPRKESKILVKWSPGMRYGDGHHLLVTGTEEMKNPGIWFAHYPNRSRAFLQRKIEIIGKAFVEHFGRQSSRPQVQQYIRLQQEGETFMDEVWARVNRRWHSPKELYPIWS